MILTIILTVWITLGVVHCAKEMACPYGRDLWLLEFIMAPYFFVVDIIDEWREWKNIMDKTK